MSRIDKVMTGLGEECGVFGAYDMDGGNMAFLHCSTEDRKAVVLR